MLDVPIKGTLNQMPQFAVAQLRQEIDQRELKISQSMFLLFVITKVTYPRERGRPYVFTLSNSRNETVLLLRV